MVELLTIRVIIEFLIGFFRIDFFYNLLDIDIPYTVKIRGIYEKRLNKKEKDMILQFIEKNKKYIEKIEMIFIDLQYINTFQ